MLYQKTIKRECSIDGSGFICDQPVHVEMRPSAPGSGVRFIRTDIKGNPEIPVHPRSQVSVEHCTTLQQGETKVIVVEHLLSACFALGVSNMQVALNGPELPTCDGSSLPWANAMLEAGLEEQAEPVKELILRKPVVVCGGDGASIIALPSEELIVEYLLNYEQSPEIGCSFALVRPDSDDLLVSLLPARTFILEEEARAALEAGKIRSTDEKLGLVIRRGHTPELRMPGELSRHKVLDMLGDLFVLGKRVRAHFVGIKSGHKLNALMVAELAARYP